MKNSYYNLFLIALIFVCLILFFLSNPVISANVTEGSTVSNVTILKSLAISFSTELSEGIKFGTVNILPAENVKAIENEAGFDNGTLYYISVSEDGNVDADFCIKAGGPMTSSDMDILGLGNETYANSTISNLTNPFLADEIALNTSYVKAGNNISVGENNYYRFWLDVPGGQPSGDYNNTIFFKGIETGFSC